MNTETAESYVEPTALVMGRNEQGQDCIVIANMPGEHRVTWEREVVAAVMPKRARGRRDAQSAREWADAVMVWAQQLREAADWADAHADELNGPDGPA